jgi:hypothetical protein
MQMIACTGVRMSVLHNKTSEEDMNKKEKKKKDQSLSTHPVKFEDALRKMLTTKQDKRDKKK